MIRPATSADTKQVAPLFILAMGHIAGIFANSERYEDAIPFFEYFFEEKNNQYSHVFTHVFEEENEIRGSITGYDGARLHELRQPILDELRKTKPDFSPDDETGPGEYYIDCINVDTRYQGQGIGKKLIGAFCAQAVALGFDRVGLIVDLDNPDAKRFYERLGFEEAGQKNFMGHRYFHMVKNVSLHSTPSPDKNA